MAFTHLAEPIPITEQNWPEGTIPLVTIDCITYNHEKYIAEAIEGFLMQQTTFPVEILIHDDASPDRTADIVREYEAKYPQLIKAIYQTENQYSKRDGTIGRIQRGRAKGKFTAICEGDDYWTDPLKLQKQVEFLDANPDYGMVHTGRSVLNNETGKIYPRPLSAPNGVEFPTFTELLMQNRIATLTVMLRSSLIAKVRDDLDSWLEPQLRRDYSTWLGVARYAKIGYIAEYTAVYRRQIGSVSNSNNNDLMLKFVSQSYAIPMAFCHEYELGVKLESNVRSAFIQRHIRVIALNRSRFSHLHKEVMSMKYGDLRYIYFRSIYILSEMIPWLPKLHSRCMNTIRMFIQAASL